MRTVLPILLFALVFLPLGSTATAEEGDETPKAEQGGWNAGAFWFADLVGPKDALARLDLMTRGVERARMRAEKARLMREYLQAWDASRRDAAALPVEDLAAMFKMLAGTEEEARIHALGLAVIAHEEAKPGATDEALRGLAGLLSSRRAPAALGEEAHAALALRLQTLVAEHEGEGASKIRGEVHAALARYLTRVGDPQAAARHGVLSAVEDPNRAASFARTFVRGLQGSTHDLEGYTVLRTSAAAVLPVLERLAAENLTAAKGSGDERVVDFAERGVRMMETVGLPLEMLGRPALDWTLEEAYGDVASLEALKGKVVVLDFWATWCPWCIKSFPAIRDLLRDYGEQDLAVVGVTASANSVYEQRWDLDDDMKEKAGDRRPRAAARLVRAGQDADPEKGLLAEADFRAKEREVLKTFISNHEMTWPVVLIDKAEPASRFALGGWPHAVVLDRQGRVRYFKSGALLRDHPEAVAAFRAVLDDLLAEQPEVPEASDATEAEVK